MTFDIATTVLARPPAFPICGRDQGGEPCGASDRDVTAGPIFILDDHLLFTSGLSLLLGELTPARERVIFDAPEPLFSALAGAAPPALVIVDLYIPGSNPTDTLFRLRRVLPECPLLVCSSTVSPVDRAEAIKAGADAFLAKDVPPDRFLECCEAVIAGNGPTADVPHPPPCAARLGLTPRQLDILVLVGKGCSNKETARLLGVSPETVKTHLSDIFLKFDVAGRVEAIEFARTHGLT